MHVPKDKLVTLVISNLAKTIELLIQREIIEVVDDCYCFQIEIVRRWFL